MESNGRNAKAKPISDDVGLKKETKDEVFNEEEDTQLLLPASGRNDGVGISKGPTKTKRKVHWNDSNGNKLAHVLEFVPSDESDSDDDDADVCLCTIM